MDVHIENDRIHKLIGDKNNPVYHGYSCIKGRNFHEWHYSERRLQGRYAKDMRAVHSSRLIPAKRWIRLLANSNQLSKPTALDL